MELETDDWASGHVEWSKERLCQAAIPGIKRSQAVADGFLSIVAMDSAGNNYHLTERQRLIYSVFPELAVWEFKNLNFDAQKNIKYKQARIRVRNI
ncbi:hypothetical protein H0H92_012084 [Tricholoma furcatifolium]|nr:hypothetical protein H0H92_012084 [Tricholoma furcatifolium]